jgi:tRNA(Arg) A34 adenosine deaminase TadA
MVASAPVFEPKFMAQALDLAAAAAVVEEVPIGCVIVDPEGRVVSTGANRTIELKDPTAHAEMVAIRAACAALGLGRLEGCDLYVTLEPCAMCAAAISFARIRSLYFGAYDPKGGAVENGARFYTLPTCHHRPKVKGGVEAERAGDLLKRFFQARRAPATARG